MQKTKFFIKKVRVKQAALSLRQKHCPVLTLIDSVVRYSQMG